MVKFFKSKLFLILEVVVLVLVISTFLKINVKKEIIRKEIRLLQEDLTTAKQESKILQEQMQEHVLGRRVELEAKRKLHFRKPEERVFVFYESDKAQGTIQKEPVEQELVFNNTSKWWNYFFK